MYWRLELNLLRNDYHAKLKEGKKRNNFKENVISMNGDDKVDNNDNDNDEQLFWQVHVDTIFYMWKEIEFIWKWWKEFEIVLESQLSSIWLQSFLIAIISLELFLIWIFKLESCWRWKLLFSIFSFCYSVDEENKKDYKKVPMKKRKFSSSLFSRYIINHFLSRNSF